MLRSLCMIWLALSGSLVIAANRPNVIVILSDDMGFSDLGCYGGEIQTPSLNALADGGLRFTQFYNTARCCPTRASLLTGLYPHQAGIGHMVNDRGADGYRGDLNQHCVTMAEVLSTAGYRCYATGKWHVTPLSHLMEQSSQHNWPLQRGFDRFYGTIHGAGSFFDPNTLVRDNEFISPFADPLYPLDSQPDQTYYYTDAISDHATRFIDDHSKSHAEQPFFMYVAYTAAHWPMHARPRDIAKYDGTYDAGYDSIRQARYERMIELGLIREDATTNFPIPEKAKMPPKHWPWDKRNMQVYAAMVDNMDQGIGRIVQTLQATGQFENTMICFMQDNGGCAEGLGRTPKQQASAPGISSAMEDIELQTDMIPKKTRDGRPIRQGRGVMAGGPDTYIAYGEAWASVSNTPFREYKHWVHEGGISTPLIVHYPAGCSRKGELEPTPGHLVDIMATVVDLADAKYPDQSDDGLSIHPMQGVSLSPLLKAGGSIEREAIYWEHEGNRAVRVGDEKLVAKGIKGPWELYDLATDRSEQNDLAAARPERVQELAAMWEAYAQRCNVYPLPK